jgi:single-strand DNA-binding protein
MADLNKVFLMGRLTFDPELRRTSSGKAVAELRLATSRSWMTAEGERREDKLFIEITVWDRQAENCCQYLRKGSGIHVEGSLKMDTWDDKTTGEKRSKIRIQADRVQFLDSKRDSGSSMDRGADDEMGAPASPRRSPAAPSRGAAGGYGDSRSVPANGPARASAGPSGGLPADDEPEDDDIPF